MMVVYRYRVYDPHRDESFSTRMATLEKIERSMARLFPKSGYHRPDAFGGWVD